MYTIKPWTPELDLTEFYIEATKRGFTNNSSERMLVSSFANEREKQVWILYYKEIALGSVAAHSFPEMGENAYRIAARTCVFTDLLPGVYGTSLRTISVITKLQNPTAQFLIPACIDWAPKGSELYITSNQSNIGTQRGVHNVFGPAMERKELMKRIKDIGYRGHTQTIWQLYPDRFLEELRKHKKW